MDCQKHLFSLEDGHHYLNCAYKSPLLKSAENALHQAILRDRNPFYLKSSDFFDEVNSVKSLVATLINAKADSIACIPSTSYGFASAFKNIKPKKKGRAITVSDEFPSGYFAIKSWSEQNDNTLSIIAPGKTQDTNTPSWNDKIIAAIDDDCSVLLLSSVHWMTGYAFDLVSIGAKCKAHDVTFLVDGSQSVGAIPIDVQACNIDALVCASYKWLFGTYSLAIAYYSDKFAGGSPIEESWMNRKNASDFTSLNQYEKEYGPKASRYNMGETSSLLLMPILKTGIEQLLEWKVDAVQAYCKNLITPFKSFLSNQGMGAHDEKHFANHLFSIELPDFIDVNHLSHNLKERNIYISQRGQYLRISVNVFNNNQDLMAIQQVLEATLQTASA